MKNKGFTLIELLAVIIILGILMLIAIPSVTNYINNSKKETFVDTVKELVKGATIKVNSGELENINNPDTTYYIPCSCVSTENGEAKSPYGKFNPAYIVVTYDGDNYNYYFTGKDIVGMGVPTITRLDLIEKETIVSNIESIDTTVGLDGKDKVVVYNNDCSAAGIPTTALSHTSGDDGPGGPSAAKKVKSNGLAANQLREIETGLYYIFIGGTINPPNNYVRFNNNEMWRIISISNNQLKIIRDSSIGRYTYNSSGAVEYENSEIKTSLNGWYLNGINADDKKMIDLNGVWNVGWSFVQDTPSVMYEKAKLLTWTGAVGIKASYEFLYATDAENCDSVPGNSYSSGCGTRDHDWLNQNTTYDSWTLTPHYYEYPGPRGVPHNISPSGYTSWGSGAYSSMQIYPSVYLKPEVKIASGTGTYGDPYILSYSE